MIFIFNNVYYIGLIDEIAIYKGDYFYDDAYMFELPIGENGDYKNFLITGEGMRKFKNEIVHLGEI